MKVNSSVSISRSYFVSYLSFSYAALAFFFCIPVYFNLLLARDMALVSLFLFFFPLMLNLDLGFGQTVLREAANTAEDMSKSSDLVRVINSIETCALVVSVGMVFASCAGVSIWAAMLGRDVLLSVVVVFGFAISLAGRWIALIYRNGALGLGLTDRVSWNNIGFTTLRFAVPIPVLYTYGGGAAGFMLFQALASAVEVLMLRNMVSRLIPLGHRFSRYNDIKESLRRIAGFTGIVGAGGVIWLASTQADKIWLFLKITAEDYNRFSIAVLLASFVSLAISPISFVLLPSLYREANSESRASYHSLFRRGTVAVVVVGGSIASILTFFGREALWVWTGNELLGDKLTVLLACYGIANVLLAISVLAHHAQITLGSLKLYLPGIVAFSTVFPVLVFIFTRQSQIEGAGFAWLLSNVLYLLLFAFYIVRKLLPTIAIRWFFVDVVWTLAICFVTGQALRWWLDASGGRLQSAVWLAVAGTTTAVVAALSSPHVSRLIYQYVRII
jgi:O-antigen/teichoic acid export membrane protein